MNKDFEKGFKFVLKWEGGYVDDPNDPGGETNLGISKRAYPELDIPSVTLSQAKDIYYRDYWLLADCDKLPFPLNICLFNCAVNCGVYRALKIMSQSGDWKDFLFNQIKFYSTLTNFKHFGRGWINRTFDLYEFISKEVITND